MAITRPPLLSSAPGTSVSTITVTDPGAIGATDVAIVVIATKGNLGITTPASWTAFGLVEGGTSDADATCDLNTYWVRGEPSTWDFVLTGVPPSSSWAYVCDVYTGCKTTGDPYHSTATATGVDNTLDLPTLTGLPANCWAVAVGGFRDVVDVVTSPTWPGTAPGSFVNRGSEFQSGGFTGAFLASYDLGAADNVPASTWTTTASPGNWAGRMIALQPDTGGTGAVLIGRSGPRLISMRG